MPDRDRLPMGKVSEEIAFTTEMAMVLFHNSPDAIVVMDVSGTIRMVNAQAELLFGWHHSELRGEKVEKLLPESLRQAHERHRTAYLDDPKIRPMGANLQLAAQRKTGDMVPVDINLSPVVTALGTFVIATIRRKRVPVPVVASGRPR